MRTLLFVFVALMILALGGCASTGPAKPPAGAGAGRKTPVAREMPSISQKILYRRLREGQQVVGRTDVEGALAR